MRKIGIVVAVLLAALAGCANVERRSAPPEFYVMRHLQTPSGVKDPDLTQEGQDNAALLVSWFKHDRPDVIYVSDTKRARQTAEPLARNLNIIPKIYLPSDTPGLIAAVLSETGTVLIVGHSNTVPEIIERLGGRRPEPLAHENFGDIWKIEGQARQTTRLNLSR